MLLRLVLPLVAGLVGFVSPPIAAAPSATPAEARAIAKEATIYGHSLVDNYRILHAYFVDVRNPDFKAPWNTLYNNPRVFTPEDRAMQTPNTDTPYSFLGMDLRTEPLVLTVPKVDPRRYHSLQLIDLYTFNFAYLGSRTTGSNGGRYLLAGPTWRGTVPAGIDKVIRSETQLAWILYRTQVFSPADIDDARAVQAGYRVQTLSQYAGAPAPKAAPAIDWMTPLPPERQRTSAAFFRLLNFTLGFAPTHPSERTMMQRFARIGVGPGKPFDAAKLSPATREALEAGMRDAWQEFDRFKAARIDTLQVTSGDLFGSREFLKNDWMRRMAGTVLGIYGNSREEAMYPGYFADGAGAPLDASKARYTLRFAPGQLPPVDAFWSVTLYELPASLLYANPLQRYLVNSAMLDSLKRDADGGITLHVQHGSPGAERESNWLPAPRGPFFLAMRLYRPQAAALDGTWKQPPLVATP